jgi:hypothetical protein
MIAYLGERMARQSEPKTQKILLRNRQLRERYDMGERIAQAHRENGIVARSRIFATYAATALHYQMWSE